MFNLNQITPILVSILILSIPSFYNQLTFLAGQQSEVIRVLVEIGVQNVALADASRLFIEGQFSNTNELIQNLAVIQREESVANVVMQPSVTAESLLLSEGRTYFYGP
jgi:hypothetical protein